MTQGFDWNIPARRFVDILQDVRNHEFNAHLIPLSTAYGVLSVAYYGSDESWVPDATYDLLCRFLLANYDKAVALGVYKTILQPDMLRQGSGFHFGVEESLPPSARDIWTIYRLAKPMVS